jgi:ketosteroid isomerase-like protein
MNTTEENRRFIQGIFHELGRGNTAPFVEALHPDVRWTTSGSSVWSRTFQGKTAVLHELLAPVRAQVVERIQLTVCRLLADGEHIVVEAKGRATTKAGPTYDNEYCFVYRVIESKIVEVTEYLDTQLACMRLRAPWAADAAQP